MKEVTGDDDVDSLTTFSFVDAIYSMTFDMENNTFKDLNTGKEHKVVIEEWNIQLDLGYQRWKRMVEAGDMKLPVTEPGLLYKWMVEAWEKLDKPEVLDTWQMALEFGNLG